MDTNQLDDGRLEKLEDHASKTEGRLGTIERTQTDHGIKLDDIGRSLATISTALTRYDARPVFNLSGFISTCRDVFAIMAVCAGFALWYVTTLTATQDKVLAKDIEIMGIQLAHQKEKLSWFDSRLSWKPSFEARP